MPSVRYRTVSLDEHPAPIHLLLSDVIMPGMNGAKLARTLTAMRPEMQVLFMSGYTDDTLSECGFSLESVHLVHKPFTFDQLQRKGRGVLDKRAAVYEST